MTVNTNKLVAALKTKREAQGLSLRKLSTSIGVSFSTLARIERGDGDPDNNTLIRILEWLGTDGHQSGLTFENVALVHFRANKNVSSKTTHCLLQAANLVKAHYAEQNPHIEPANLADQSNASTSTSVARSKSEMDEMANGIRAELGISLSEPLEPLVLKIAGVDVLVPSQITSLPEDCSNHLTGTGSDEWSAMSVPLNADNTKWTILRNNDHNIERQRVTYLEECWHILLGHKLTKISKIADAYGRTYDNSEEHDAYYLASACLLPAASVTSLVQEGKSADDIGAHFGTSPELVEYRIKRLGLWRVYKGLALQLGNFG